MSTRVEAVNSSRSHHYATDTPHNSMRCTLGHTDNDHYVKLATIEAGNVQRNRCNQAHMGLTGHVPTSRRSLRVLTTFVGAVMATQSLHAPSCYALRRPTRLSRIECLRESESLCGAYRAFS